MFSGAADSGESQIRHWILENDWLEAIVALPDQLFYNTGISTYIWVLSTRKNPERKGKVQLVNALSFFQKMRKSLGNKRNELTAQHIEEITRIYGEFREGKLCRIFDTEDFGYRRITVERPLRLNFQASPERIERVRETDAFRGLAKTRKKGADGEREAQGGLALQECILEALGSLDTERCYRSRPEFVRALDKVLKAHNVTLPTPLRKVILTTLSERDETAEICSDAKGNPEPDPDLRDNENVPLKEDVQAYFEREVLPHVPDAWVDHDKTRIGYEIPFTRHFYEYKPLRSLEEVGTEIRGQVKKIQQVLEEIEDRQAIIARVVTKGLDPKVAMQDAGVPWMGMIPAHWKVAPTRLVARLESGHTPSRQHPEWWLPEECTIPWFSLADVWQIREGRKEYVKETAERVSKLGLANSSARLLPAGTVILSRTASVGFSAIMEIPMATTQDFANWVCGPLILPEYLLYVFRSMRTEFDRLIMGSTHQTIYMPEIRSFSTPLPPVDEQRRIVAAIRDNLGRIGSAVDAADDLVKSLRDYGQSFITATITGKVPLEEAPS